jgi:hypothetical protein
MYDRQLRLGAQRGTPQVAPLQASYVLKQGGTALATSSASLTLVNLGGLTVLKGLFVLSAAAAAATVELDISYLSTVPIQVFGTFGQSGSTTVSSPITINAGAITTHDTIIGAIGDTYTFQGVL